ncbi:MAG UNVERIFIED_CONTAM: type I DNA topoisomerase [Rickettsiaceae bacterium]|jgi:DNA topoisomerase-1
MKLVIVESPAKAKTINKYLGSDYEVIASFGHIRDLPSKNGSVLPDEDFAMKYEVPTSSAKHVKAICDLAKKADTIYLATDPDREGESISWHVVEVLKEKKALKKDTLVKRVAFNEITKKSVLAAIEDARDVDQALVDAQQARRALDYLVGFTLSPVLWRKLPGSRSAGRVQSVALRLICEREHEIEKFVTREYWSIVADMLNAKDAPFKATLNRVKDKKLEKFDVTNAVEAAKLVEELKKHEYIITSIEKKQQRRNPPAPFTTSSLQQESSRKLGFGAKKTMMIAQKLYEGIDINGETKALITYMRTDGVSLAGEAIEQTRKWINSNLGEKYLPAEPRLYKAKAKNAQEAHEAIRPIDPMLTPEQVKHIDVDFYKLYDLIWKRTIACQMENVVLDTVAATIDSEDKQYGFRATGSTIAFDGFYRIYMEGTDEKAVDEDSNMLPQLNENEKVSVEDIIPNQHFTEPPPRYSEASLVKKLEELGIGRPSTYASIISVLQDRNYVKLDKKRFIPENRGMIVTAFLVNSFLKYVEYNFTAELEDKLDEVSNGKLDWKVLLKDFWGGFNDNIKEVEKYKISDVIDQLDEVLSEHLFPESEGKDPRKCPSCENGRLGLKLGKFGAFIACSNYPECKFTKQITEEVDNNMENKEEIQRPADLVLGQNQEGVDILLKKGPYGPYLQLGASNENKPKRATIPPNYKPEDVDLEIALFLLSLPKAIGNHPDTGEEVQVGIGKYGPYIKYLGKFISIPKNQEIADVTMSDAVEILAKSKK